MDEASATPTPPLDPKPSRLEKAADAGLFVLRHKELLVAALELLREREAVSQDDEVRIVSAYETGSETVRGAIKDLVEKLQIARVGHVAIALQDVPAALKGAVTGGDASALRESLAPAFAEAKAQIATEARPYLEKAKQRLQELKTLEEPTLRRLEAVGSDLADAGREVARGLKGAGREAADEIVRRSKNWLISAQTEELEREFFDWALVTLPKAERGATRLLVGTGVVLVLSAVLLGAQQFAVLREASLFLAIFGLLFVGFSFVNWGMKLSEASKSGRGEIERLARMSPGERRVHLTRRWAQRTAREGHVRPEDLRLIIEETLYAQPEEPGLGPSAADDGAGATGRLSQKIIEGRKD